MGNLFTHPVVDNDSLRYVNSVQDPRSHFMTTRDQIARFASNGNEVQATEHIDILVKKLKNIDLAYTLIVTSIQKKSKLNDEVGSLKTHDLDTVRAKRIVFTVDECHRSTFGDMFIDIKNSFSRAVFFSFSGTPIQLENVSRDNTSTDVFDDELHRCSIVEGIRDKNILGFDPYQVLIYRDLRHAVALEKAKSITVVQALADDAKKMQFNSYMNVIPMAGHRDTAGVY